MIPDKPPTLNEFLDDKGYSCTVCYETYDANNPKKKPTQLSCQQHSLCIECVEKAIRAGNITSCPQCRKPVTFSGPIVANSQVISAMEIATELWKTKNPSTAITSSSSSSSASSAAITSSSAAADVKKILIPEAFKCHSLCEQARQYPNINSRIEAALPAIVNAMGWQKVIDEYQPGLPPTDSWLCAHQP